MVCVQLTCCLSDLLEYKGIVEHTAKQPRSESQMVSIHSPHLDLGLTAAAAALDWDMLDQISTRITNSVNTVNRVLVQLGGPEAQEMHVHVAMPDASRVTLLQLADKIVHDALIDANWLGKVFT